MYTYVYMHMYICIYMCVCVCIFPYLIPISITYFSSLANISNLHNQQTPLSSYSGQGQPLVRTTTFKS